MQTKSYSPKVKNLILVLTASVFSTILVNVFFIAVRGDDFSIAGSVVLFSAILLCALFLGAPIYLLLSKFLKRRWYLAGLTGFFTGGVPALILAFFLSPSKEEYDILKNSLHYSPPIYFGYEVTEKWVEDLIGYSFFIIIFGGLGLIGATTAWFVRQRLGYDNDT